MKTKNIKDFEQARNFTLVKLEDLRNQIKNLIKMNALSEHEKYILTDAGLSLLAIQYRFELSTDDAKEEYFKQKEV